MSQLTNHVSLKDATTTTGLLNITTIDIEIVVDYDVTNCNEYVNQMFYCEQDNEMANSGKNTAILIISTTAAITLIVVTTILIVVVACCWRRYKLLVQCGGC